MNSVSSRRGCGKWESRVALLDGEKTIILEIEIEHLTPIHALGFQPPHRFVEQEGLAAAPDADQSDNLS